MSAAASEQLVSVPAGPVALEGALALPARAVGIVVFAHGSGSGRLSPRNQFVAAQLHKLGLGTLLVDLLTNSEDKGDEKRFDIGLRTQRLGYAVHFVLSHPATQILPIGLFGASTGAASALRVAAAMPKSIAAVVSRGGRPDLAGIEALRLLRAATLFIVGGLDFEVIKLNKLVRDGLVCEERELAIVPGATHLFEEHGTLDEVARLAGQWFVRHMPAFPLRRDNLCT